MPTPLFVGGNDFVFYNKSHVLHPEQCVVIETKKNKKIKGSNNKLATTDELKKNSISSNYENISIKILWIILIMIICQIIAIIILLLLLTRDKLFFNNF